MHLSSYTRLSRPYVDPQQKQMDLHIESQKQWADALAERHLGNRVQVDKIRGCALRASIILRTVLGFWQSAHHVPVEEMAAPAIRVCGSRIICAFPAIKSRNLATTTFPHFSYCAAERLIDTFCMHCRMSSITLLCAH
jgi:hypothetical protein